MGKTHLGGHSLWSGKSVSAIDGSRSVRFGSYIDSRITVVNGR